MAFDDNDSKTNSKKTVTLGNQPKSMFDSMPKKPKQADFQNTVNDVERQKLDYANRAIDVMKKLNQVISNKTLPENKMIFDNSFENEVVDNFIDLLTDINTDENQADSEGSVMGIGYLLRTILSQRDRINKLEFELYQLKQK